ncbi:MAG: helix-turn-helix transcriptional regulator [Bacilli bacterium]|nr:helix-turn-helix transcriptional regulator [Bacilli bacterium]
MNSEELKLLIEDARIKKGISQRELAKLTGISRSTLNDLINGKIKKVDIDDLRKIAETLDISLQKLLKAAGYDEMSLYFNKNKLKDRYYDKSSKDLKELVEQYKKSEIDLLDFDSQKRRKISDARQKLFYTMEHLKIMQNNKDSLYTIDKAIEDIKYAFEELEFAEHKYDYSKLPKQN